MSAPTPPHDLREQLADILSDENGLPPTRAALDVLMSVIDALEGTDADWTENDECGAPAECDYASHVIGSMEDYL